MPAASKPRPTRSRNKLATNGQVKSTAPSPAPTGFDASLLEGLSHEELIGLVEEIIGGGITVNFSGKANATRIARKVRPRVVRRIKTLSVGDAAAQAGNLLIEGDNLQAMATEMMDGYTLWGIKAGSGRTVKHFDDLDKLMAAVLTARRG